MTELFYLTVGLAGLVFFLLLGLFLVAAFSVLFLEPDAYLASFWRSRRRARKAAHAKRSHDRARTAKIKAPRYYTPTPRLHRRFPR